MAFCPIVLLTDKMPGNSGNDLRYDNLPQYNAENSVTNRLVKQMKKAKVVSIILLTNVHQQPTIAARALSRCARRIEFSRRDNFRDSNERRT